MRRAIAVHKGGHWPEEAAAEGTGKARQTPIGNLPAPDALDVSGLNLPAGNLEELLRVDQEGWKKEIADVEANYAKFGSRLPAALAHQLDNLRRRL